MADAAEVLDEEVADVVEVERNLIEATIDPKNTKHFKQFSDCCEICTALCDSIRCTICTADGPITDFHLYQHSWTKSKIPLHEKFHFLIMLSTAFEYYAAFREFIRRCRLLDGEVERHFGALARLTQYVLLSSVKWDDTTYDAFAFLFTHAAVDDEYQNSYKATVSATPFMEVCYGFDRERIFDARLNLRLHLPVIRSKWSWQGKVFAKSNREPCSDSCALLQYFNDIEKRDIRCEKCSLCFRFPMFLTVMKGALEPAYRLEKIHRKFCDTCGHSADAVCIMQSHVLCRFCCEDELLGCLRYPNYCYSPTRFSDHKHNDQIWGATNVPNQIRAYLEKKGEGFAALTRYTHSGSFVSQVD